MMIMNIFSREILTTCWNKINNKLDDYGEYLQLELNLKPNGAIDKWRHTMRGTS